MLAFLFLFFMNSVYVSKLTICVDFCTRCTGNVFIVVIVLFFILGLSELENNDNN